MSAAVATAIVAWGAMVRLLDSLLRFTRGARFFAFGTALVEGFGALIGRGRDFQRRDRMTKQALDSRDILPVDRRRDGDGGPGQTGTTGAADAVHVVL